MKVAFLLGSGISVGVGLPSTKDITKILLDGGIKKENGEEYEKRIYCDTTQKYHLREKQPYVGDNPYPFSGRQIDVPQIRGFLNWLRNEVIVPYWRNCQRSQKGENVNYEDFFSLVEQLDVENFGRNNPALLPLLVWMQTRFPEWMGDYQSKTENATIANATQNYIKSIVPSLLGKKMKGANLDPLAFITEAIDQQKGNMDIFTLNNDLLIERKLQEGCKTFSDGFGVYNENEQRDWHPDSFSTSNICLFKLHGSLRWFGYSNAGNERIAHPPIWIPYATKQKIDENREELLLIGTLNKFFRYTHPVFLELMHQFHSRLEKVDSLLVCGYSFGDTAINQAIAYWIAGSTNRRLFIFDPSEEMPFWKNADAPVILLPSVGVRNNNVHYARCAVGNSPDGLPSLTWDLIQETMDAL